MFLNGKQKGANGGIAARMNCVSSSPRGPILGLSSLARVRDKGLRMFIISKHTTAAAAALEARGGGKIKGKEVG